MKHIPNFKKLQYIVGIDEAGRGPIAGPVAVGVVQLRLSQKFKNPFPEIVDGKFFKDSKKLSPLMREKIFRKMIELQKRGELEFTVSMSSNTVIDKKGITHAINSAISRSLRRVVDNPKKAYVILDGRLKAPPQFHFQETFVKGDTKYLAISLASIAAKVTRDRYMVRQAKKYSSYGFDSHKGYGTKAHYRALKKKGMSDIHRQTFLTGIR